MLGSLFRITALFLFLGIASVVGSIVLSSYILEIPVTEVIHFIINDVHPIFLTK
jgi:hypothetical protein